MKGGAPRRVPEVSFLIISLKFKCKIFKISQYHKITFRNTAVVGYSWIHLKNFVLQEKCKF